MRSTGIITPAEARRRIAATLASVARLERHEPSGMFYSWYDPAAGLPARGFWVDPPGGQCTITGDYRGDVPDVLYTCHHYGTLNTEPRIASYLGIALGRVPATPYFRMSRTFPPTCDWGWQEQQPAGPAVAAPRGLHQRGRDPPRLVPGPALRPPGRPGQPGQAPPRLRRLRRGRLLRRRQRRHPSGRASRVADLAAGILRDMGTALVIMLMLFGVFVGIPLWMAWLSATGRFARVEWVMGVEPWHRQSSRWAWVWPLAGAAMYAVMGVVLLAQGHRLLGVMNLVTGGFWGLQLPVMVWIKRRQAASRSPPRWLDAMVLVTSSGHCGVWSGSSRRGHDRGERWHRS